MKKLFMLISAIVLLVVFNYTTAQTNGASSGTAKEKSDATTKIPAGSDTEQELRRITKKLLDAQLRGDKSVIERYLAANYIETNGNGKVNTKAQELENAQASPAGYRASFDFEDVQVQEYGTTAVMSCKVKYGFDRNGQRLANLYRITNVYVKQDEQWQLIAQHQSSIPADKTVVKVDPAIYDAYVGQYELASNHFLTLIREDDKLIGQTTSGKTKWDFLPENETTFFLKGTRDQITFVKDDKGQVTHINHRLSDGQVVKEKKDKVGARSALVMVNTFTTAMRMHQPPFEMTGRKIFYNQKTFMKSILSFSILLISALSVHGQTGNKKSNTEQEIRKLSNDWMVAMMKRDSGTLNRIVAPEFELGGTDFDNPKLPPPVSRETWMKNTMQNLKVDSVRYITMKVRIIENVAIVQSAFYWSATFLAQPVRNDTANLIDTWIKRKQGWQVVNRLVVDPIKE